MNSLCAVDLGYVPPSNAEARFVKEHNRKGYMLRQARKVLRQFGSPFTSVDVRVDAS